MRKPLLSAGSSLLLMLNAYAASAQQLFNISHSNYVGINEISWNPAAIADSRYGFQLHLASLDGHATNSAYRYTGPWRLNNLDQNFNIRPSYFAIQDNDRPKVISTGLHVRGPGLMVRLGQKQSIAVSSRVRAALQGNYISQDLVRNALAKFDVKGRAANNTFNFNLNAFAEWDLTYARVLLEEGDHFLKAGVTVKRLMGAGSAYLQAKTVDYEIVGKAATVRDTTVRLHNLDAAFGYSNPEAFNDLDADQAAEWLTAGGAPGTGWGADIGFVYEYRPDAGQYRYRTAKGKERTDQGRNKYQFRLSASLTDMGSIRYREKAAAYNAIKVQNLGVSESDINGGNLGNFYTRISDIVQAQERTKEDNFKTGLPTALNVDLDYHLAWKLYANAAVSQGLRGRYAVGMRNFSYAALTPRFETRWLELAAPLSLTNNYRMFAYGLTARLGPLTVGSNNIAALLSSSKPYGANVFAEFSLLTWASKRHKTKAPKRARAPKTVKS